MSNNELKGCPFCGHKVSESKGAHGITFFDCSYKRCGAIISFYGSKRLAGGLTEAENPRENFNRRAAE